MRPIDADNLESLCDIMSDKCDGIGESIWNQFRTVVEWSPTIDAVPVVRCKDCKWWKLSEYNTYGIHVCKKFSGVRGESDFCSRGEGSEDGQT